MAIMVKKPYLQIVLMIIQTIGLIFFALLSAFCIYMFSTGVNLPYDENGRYFDAEDSVVYDKFSIVVYGFFMTVFMFLAIVTFLWTRRTVRKYQAGKTKMYN